MGVVFFYWFAVKGGENVVGKKAKKIKERLIDLFKGIFGSKRRSRLGVGAEKLNPECPRYYRTAPTAPLVVELPDELLGAKVLTREDKWEMLRRGKLYLTLRTVEDFDELLGLDWRRVWNKENPKRPIKTLQDLFPSYKFAHESMLPLTARLRKRGIDPKSIDWRHSPWHCNAVRNSAREKGSLFYDIAQVIECPEIPTARDLFRDEYVDIVSCEKNGNETIRMDDVCRSHSIWLDPIDAPKELYKWRLRVQKAICWAYLNDCVPVMMTLTIYHRWNNLDGLLSVLQNSWDKFLVSGRPAQNRQVEMGLVGNIRRLEITINDGDENFDENGKPDTNAGWHPHFHVLLFVPKDKFGTLSDMEAQMKKDWAEIVAENYKAEFDKEIETSFLPALEKYGLWLSRYNKGERKGELRPVKDSAYFAKIMGYDPANVYGGDKEVTSDAFKNSKIPFDLLCEVTAANIDLWCEYAIATKGMSALRISKPFAKKINEYFDAHPDKDPIPKDLPPSKVVAHLEHTIYRLFYRNFLIPQLKAKAAEGFDALRSWVRDKMVELGVSALCDDPTALPRPPNSVDDLLCNKILPST